MRDAAQGRGLAALDRHGRFGVQASGDVGPPLIAEDDRSGIVGGVNVARMGAALANVPRGGSVWTFALMD